MLREIMPDWAISILEYRQALKISEQSSGTGTKSRVEPTSTISDSTPNLSVTPSDLAQVYL
jgi:hypothetical protein